MIENKLSKIIESILFSSGDCVTINKLSEILGVDNISIVNATNELIYFYKETSIEIIKIDDGYQMCTKKEYFQYIAEYLKLKKNTPLSTSALEVLAIVAYNEQVTKSFIEQIRGIDSNTVVNNLIDKNLLKEGGRLDLPGRPMSYKITSNFLRCFNLTTLKDLPSIKDYQGVVGNDTLDNQLSL
ncbi:MAG: SMC-Scp complex subunit ScpB [Oscillospiraceae bacterium]